MPQWVLAQGSFGNWKLREKSCNVSTLRLGAWTILREYIIIPVYIQLEHIEYSGYVASWENHVYLGERMCQKQIVDRKNPFCE